MSWHPLANKKKGKSPKIGLLPRFLYKRDAYPHKVVPIISEYHLALGFVETYSLIVISSYAIEE